MGQIASRPIPICSPKVAGQVLVGNTNVQLNKAWSTNYLNIASVKKVPHCMILVSDRHEKYQCSQWSASHEMISKAAHESIIINSHQRDSIMDQLIYMALEGTSFLWIRIDIYLASRYQALYQSSISFYYCIPHILISYILYLNLDSHYQNDRIIRWIFTIHKVIKIQK